MLIITSSLNAISFRNTPNSLSLEKGEFEIKNFEIKISEKDIKKFKEEQNILINESNSIFSSIDKNKIPYYVYHTTFPLGTDIVDVECSNLKLNTNGGWFSYTTGAGIKNEERVTLLSIQFYPIPGEDKKSNLVKDIDVQVRYKLASTKNNNEEDYKLLILAPAVFKKSLQKLVEHKNSHDFPTRLVTLSEIYSDKYFEIEGRDKAEEIKYFIYNAYKNWNISYVLLVGNINRFPMRSTWIGFGNNVHSPLTDLYYADICFPDGSFCSWDSNNNGYYGEKLHEGETDLVDLYPDVYIGRLACNNIYEVIVVVNKIVSYETNAYGAEWANNIILAGGDTHPYHNNFLEGEFLIEKIKDVIPSMNHIFLKTSDGTYSAESLNNQLNAGAGFLCYSGHGFETGLGTHPPNSDEWIDYNFFDSFSLKNKDKLPIMFFSACLTARLDYNVLNGVADLIYSLNDNPRLEKPELSFPILFPCFAWRMVSMQKGGAIATIGATRVSYGLIDSSGVRGGCCYLALKFFESYQTSEYLSQMLVSAKNDYIDNVSWLNPLIVQEFILLGDPSLKIGGYAE